MFCLVLSCLFIVVVMVIVVVVVAVAVDFFLMLIQ